MAHSRIMFVAAGLLFLTQAITPRLCIADEPCTSKYKDKTPSSTDLQTIMQQNAAWLKNQIVLNLNDPKVANDPRRANLCGAIFVGLNLDGYNLEGANLSGAHFEGMTLVGVNLNHADLRGAEFSGATLRNVNLDVANLGPENLGIGPLGVYSHYSHPGMPILIPTQLIGATLPGVYLRGAILRGAFLAGADLTSAHLENADLREANLLNTKFNSADLTETDFVGATISGTDFRDADLSRANLTGANLSGLRLDHIDLSSANLADANLQDAKLQGALMTEANVAGTFLDCDSDSLPKVVPGLYAAKYLSLVKFHDQPGALVKLRSDFRNLGLRSQKNQLTCAIRRSELNRQRDDGQYVHAWPERAFNLVAFDWTCEYGMSPQRPLLLVIIFGAFFTFVYMLVQFVPRLGGIWAVWEETWIHRATEAPPQRLIGFPSIRFRSRSQRFLSAMMLAAYFSLLSALRIGWSGLNFGTWISRIQLREYSLHATRWVRVVSGVQSLISVYLIALAILTYFGTPFEY